MDVSELQRSFMPKFRVEGFETSEPLKFKFFRVFITAESLSYTHFVLKENHLLFFADFLSSWRI